MRAVQISEPEPGRVKAWEPLLLRSTAKYYGAEAMELPWPGDGETSHMQAVGRLRRELKRLRPAVAIVCGARLLPVVAGLRPRPAVILYAATDCSPFHDAWTAEAAGSAVVCPDVALYAEELSAAAEITLCQRFDVPARIVYPCLASESAASAEGSPAARRPVVAYDGAAVLEPFGGETILAKMPAAWLQMADGQTPSAWRQAAFRLVGRSPCCEYGRRVAPPEFFESLAAGVPVVAAPNFQSREFVERYGCGIVADNWSAEAIEEAIATAQQLCGTAAYDALVANCARAVQRELNWDFQFAKVASLLPENRSDG